jgi:two-component system, NarL family, response regulator DevR
MGGARRRRDTSVMQVFLVEDSPLIRERLVALLESVPGAQICGHAESAEAAVREILATRPDVVVLDLSLAGGTGFDVLRAVHPRAPQIDFYLLSNFSAAPYRALAGRLGARGFFDKSDEFERVRDVIREKTLCMP